MYHNSSGPKASGLEEIEICAEEIFKEILTSSITICDPLLLFFMHQFGGFCDQRKTIDYNHWSAISTQECFPRALGKRRLCVSQLASPGKLAKLQRFPQDSHSKNSTSGSQG